MIVHVVLFEPRPDLSDEERQALLAGLEAAAAHIPSIRRFRVGRRLRHGRPGYEQAMTRDFAYAALLEFDDRAGLEAYLAHPAHEGIGRHFTASAAASLAYDYEVVEASEAPSLL